MRPRRTAEPASRHGLRSRLQVERALIRANLPLPRSALPRAPLRLRFASPGQRPRRGASPGTAPRRDSWPKPRWQFDRAAAMPGTAHLFSAQLTVRSWGSLAWWFSFQPSGQERLEGVGSVEGHARHPLPEGFGVEVNPLHQLHGEPRDNPDLLLALGHGGCV